MHHNHLFPGCVRMLFQIFNIKLALPLASYVYDQFGCMPAEARRNSGSSGTGVTDGFKTQSGFCEPSVSPLQEQPMCLTAKPPFQAPK